jgi:hypothetical protein
MTTIHHSPPGATPFSIYEDTDDQAPPSPSEVYDDTSFHSDDIIASIENENEEENENMHEFPEPTPLEPYVPSYTSRPSSTLGLSQPRRVSGVTSTSFISSLPSEISVSSKPVQPANNLDSRYSPRKERPPFRNPASVRAMQMSSPPPLPAYDSPRERVKGNYKLATPSRGSRSESVATTGSRRSRAQRDSVHSAYEMVQSPRGTPTPQQSLPLVLLHVTILPIQLPYSQDFMMKAMPEWLVENYRVLGDKLQDIVLMNRGILISHPREEYDVLEERILESLELKTPRLLKCGHFLGPDADADDDQLDDDEDSVMDDGIGRASRMSGGTVMAEEEAEWKYPSPESDDASICTDCHRQVKRPGRGVGAGTKRWEIKIYAANGLMRAGAWSAAWSEMERCDVEISPWIPDDMRKALDKRMQEEQEAAQRKQMYTAELERQIAAEAAMQKKMEEEAEAKRIADEAEAKRRIEFEAELLQQKLLQEAEEKRRLEESLDEKIEEAKETIRLEFEAQALAEAHSVAERLRAMEDALKREQEKTAIPAPPIDVPTIQHHSHSRSRGRPRSISRRPQIEEIPIGTLLKNYMLLQLRDSRNYLIVILGALVFFFTTNADHDWTLRAPQLGTIHENALGSVIDAVPSVVITSTATTTATSIATLTITEVEQAVPTYGASMVEELQHETSSLSLEFPALSEKIVNQASVVSEALSEAVDWVTSVPVPAVLEEAVISASSFVVPPAPEKTESVSPVVDVESTFAEPTSAVSSLPIELTQGSDLYGTSGVSEGPAAALDKDEL